MNTTMIYKVFGKEEWLYDYSEEDLDGIVIILEIISALSLTKEQFENELSFNNCSEVSFVNLIGFFILYLEYYGFWFNNDIGGVYQIDDELRSLFLTIDNVLGCISNGFIESTTDYYNSCYFEKIQTKVIYCIEKTKLERQLPEEQYKWHELFEWQNYHYFRSRYGLMLKQK